MAKKIPNEYKHLENGITILLITRQNGKTYEVLIETNDYEKVKGKHWSLVYSDIEKFYAFTRINKKMIGLHRFLFDKIPKGMVIDHINRISLDNRKSNLRIVTPLENARNKVITKRWAKK